MDYYDKEYKGIVRHSVGTFLFLLLGLSICTLYTFTIGADLAALHLTCWGICCMSMFIRCICMHEELFKAVNTSRHRLDGIRDRYYDMVRQRNEYSSEVRLLKKDSKSKTKLDKIMRVADDVRLNNRKIEELFLTVHYIDKEFDGVARYSNLAIRPDELVIRTNTMWLAGR